jgi:hypothetical protein
VKRLLFTVIAAVATVPAFAGDVSATLGISQPGFYGQITIGDLPRPAVIYTEPMWVERPVKVVRVVQPIYLHVPPGHAKHWSKHCAEYGACGRPVYFVREDWYQTYYVPHHQGRGDRDDDHGPNQGHGRGEGKGKGNGR